MAAKVSELWARAVNRFEEESRRALENLRKNASRARSGKDVEHMLREAYERIERSITFPSPDELESLSDRIEALSERLERLEQQHGIPTQPRKKRTKKKKAKSGNKKAAGSSSKKSGKKKSSSSKKKTKSSSKKKKTKKS